ncbi:MAG: hypothetical protein IT323_09385, partial [Anaerolineae bacterium]|nr:hypothetical protein [Anaerolineae bacterium]
VLPSPTIPVPVVATVEPTSIPATAAPLEPPTSPAPSKGPQPSTTVVALAPTAATPEKMNLALTNEAQAATQNAQAATLDAQAAATIGFRQTQTALAVASFTATATPNLEETLGAIVAQTETSQAATDIAIMIASYTKTPTATPTPSFTPTFTMTPTATATPTSTYTPTATPTPALIVMPDPPPDLVLSPANAAQIHELSAIRAVASGGGWADDLAISPDARLLAANTLNTITFYDLSTLRELDSLSNRVGFHYGMVFAPDWSLLVSAGASQENNTLTLWDPATPAQVGEIEGLGDFGANFSDGPIMALAPDARSMAVRLGWPTQNVIKIVSVPGGDVLHTLTVDDFGSLTTLIYSPDGRYLASGSYSGVHVWSTNDWQGSVLDIGYPSTARHVTFSPDGRYLAALQAASPEQVFVWDVSTFRQVLGFRASDQYPAFDGAMAFSPDGNILATGHDSGEVKLWDTSNGQLLVALAGHADEILAIAFAPNGTGLLSSSQDGTIRLWGLATGAE